MGLGFFLYLPGFAPSLIGFLPPGALLSVPGSRALSVLPTPLVSSRECKRRARGATPGTLPAGCSRGRLAC
jgi:hypothetical protein